MRNNQGGYVSEPYILEQEYFNIIRSNLVTHHNKTITAELIDLITKQIGESFEHFINSELQR